MHLLMRTSDRKINVFLLYVIACVIISAIVFGVALKEFTPLINKHKSVVEHYASSAVVDKPGCPPPRNPISAQPASLGISYERGLYWHKFGSFLWVVFGIIHGVRETPQVVQIFRAKNLLGLIILLVTALSALFYYCHQRFKLFTFEWFYVCHIVLFMVVTVVAWLHGGLLTGQIIFSQPLSYACDIYRKISRLQLSQKQTVPNDLLTENNTQNPGSEKSL
jgi:hypothetical protein